MINVLVHSAESFGVDDKCLHTGKVRVVGLEDLSPKPQPLCARVDRGANREPVIFSPVQKDAVDEEALARAVLADN